MKSKFLSSSDSKRFWSRVAISGPEECWNWTATKHKFGYGKISICGKEMLSHRIAYLDQRGEIPPGLVIRHACDNPSCCNPSHLDIGTQRDNIHDALIRGRKDQSKVMSRIWKSRMVKLEQDWATKLKQS